MDSSSSVRMHQTHSNVLGIEFALIDRPSSFCGGARVSCPFPNNSNNNRGVSWCNSPPCLPDGTGTGRSNCLSVRSCEASLLPIFMLVFFFFTQKNTGEPAGRHLSTVRLTRLTLRGIDDSYGTRTCTNTVPVETGILTTTE
jgi:hypothetical protein